MQKTAKIYGSIVVAVLIIVFSLASLTTVRSQTVARVIPAAEGTYYGKRPNNKVTSELALSNRNKRLPVNDHDDSLPTLPGYYFRRSESSAFTRFPFKTVVVRRGYARFTTISVKGVHFVFRGKWGTAFEEQSNIEDVPYMYGTLTTYRKGKLVKRERIRFGHHVNA